MIFDNLCGIAERQLHLLIPILQETRLFHFDGIVHEVLSDAYKGKTQAEMDEISDSFFLPYSSIAIEDQASCIIFIDFEKNQVGLNTKRFWIEAMKFNLHPKGFNSTVRWSDEQKKMIEQKQIENQMIIHMGYSIGKKLTPEKLLIGGDTKALFTGNKNELVDRTPYINNDDDRDFVNANSLQNIIAAYNQVIYFNQPNRFILRTSPVKYKAPKKGRILRTHQRPIYTMLYPEVIREKLGMRKIDKRLTRIAHERRRHWRFLSDIKYRFDENGNEIKAKTIPWGPRRGEKYYKKVIVPATWIGPSEKVIRNKLYKVMIDR